MKRRLQRAGWLALFIVWATSATARADDVRYRRMRFVESNGNLAVTTQFEDLFDGKNIQRLTSGFPMTIVLRFLVQEAASEYPVAAVAVRIQIVYDLWERSFVIRTEGPSRSHTRVAHDRARALSAVTRVIRLPVAPLTTIAVGPHYRLSVIAELNPIDDELLAEVKRWLTRAPGTSRLDTGRVFFGSVVSFFANPKLDRAERTLLLRSQPFYRVPR